jgi:hypothetical protein
VTATIEATIFKGYGAASKNIKFQMPHLIWHFPEIENIYTATINVLLDEPLGISEYDFTTLPIPWWDVDHDRPGFWAEEVFSFIRIAFEYPVGASPKSAWFYIGHNSAYFDDARRFEVITEKIEAPTLGARCRVHIP